MICVLAYWRHLFVICSCSLAKLSTCGMGVNAILLMMATAFSTEDFSQLSSIDDKNDYLQSQVIFNLACKAIINWHPVSED